MNSSRADLEDRRRLDACERYGDERRDVAFDRELVELGRRAIRNAVASVLSGGGGCITGRPPDGFDEVSM